jgi:hypothetical protein
MSSDYTCLFLIPIGHDRQTMAATKPTTLSAKSCMPLIFSGAHFSKRKTRHENFPKGRFNPYHITINELIRAQTDPKNINISQACFRVLVHCDASRFHSNMGCLRIRTAADVWLDPFIRVDHWNTLTPIDCRCIFAIGDFSCNASNGLNFCRQ